MNEAQESKINAVVARCLDECLAQEHPFLHVATCLESLTREDWTVDEIAEAQSRLVRALLAH